VEQECFSLGLGVRFNSTESEMHTAKGVTDTSNEQHMTDTAERRKCSIAPQFTSRRKNVPNLSQEPTALIFLCQTRNFHTASIKKTHNVLFFYNGSSSPFRARPLIQFRNNFSQAVGLLGRVISPSQGCYLNTGQHKHRMNAYTHQTSMP
jgi:hypothetical protein